MDPIMLQLGPLAIRWYGFLIATGVLIGSIWALHAARRRGMDTDKLLDSAFWLVLAGIVGARLVYVLDRESTRLNSSHVAISYAGFCWRQKRVTSLLGR